MTLGWWPQTWESQFSCLEIGDETVIRQGILWMMGGKSWRVGGFKQHGGDSVTVSRSPTSRLLTHSPVPLFEVSSSWFLLTLEWSACL